MRKQFSFCSDGYLKLVAMGLVVFFWIAGAWVVSLFITYLYGWLIYYDKENFESRKFCCLVPVVFVYSGLAVAVLFEIKGSVTLSVLGLGLFFIMSIGKCFKEANEAQKRWGEEKKASVARKK